MPDVNLTGKKYISREAIGPLWREVIQFTVTDGGTAVQLQTRLNKVYHFFVRAQSGEKNATTLCLSNVVKDGDIIVGGFPASSNGTVYLVTAWGK